MTSSALNGARACIIFNPTARGEGAQRAVRELPTLDGDCLLKPSLAAGMAQALAAEAVREGFGTIVAMGGDGTVNEVLNGIANEPGGLERARLGVLPVGTVNVFARELGIPFNLRRAWSIVCQGRERTIDLPQMEFQRQPSTQQRWFAQMAGCGLDARAVELLDWNLKKRIGQFAYVVSAAKALREKKSTLSVSDGPRQFSGQLVLIGNGRLYGGPIAMFAQADLQDGLLDVCVFPKVNWWVVARYACAYFSPLLLSRGAEQSFQASSVTIESSEQTPVQLDGELVGYLPVRCSVRRQALRVVVP